MAGPWRVQDLDFRLSIQHPDPYDIQAFLKSLSGTEIQLIWRATSESGGDGNSQDTYFDDSGDGPIGSDGHHTAPFLAPEWGGIKYQPQLNEDGDPPRLSEFNGSDPNGTWTLTIFGKDHGVASK